MNFCNCCLIFSELYYLSLWLFKHFSGASKDLRPREFLKSDLCFVLSVFFSSQRTSHFKEEFCMANYFKAFNPQIFISNSNDVLIK